ncbi:MAG: 8-amino-7-oxononanoate synthase [Dysgonamonadaceae bacterium]|jgi:8-amino-7-oxononanoate synthase|nr:8-amino-7-oxononanoate synthase [Dysgonamonadaceae bacterium]
MIQYYKVQLEKFKTEGRFRTIPSFSQSDSMINFSSNDYLGLAQDEDLKTEFLSQLPDKKHLLSSSSARLLTGNFEAHEQLESTLAKLYRKSALTFNSGYHANIGILPSIADKNTLILADKLVHASLIDGIHLSRAKNIRYRHNDYAHLEHLVEYYAQQFERIIIVTESIFSMNGDEADLPRLVALKKQYKNVMLYVDEAHAVGIRGKSGLGCVEEHNCIADVDFIVGTFGKALASMGAYVICDEIFCDYLVNKARSFIFSTTLPPINALWTNFILERLSNLTEQREILKSRSEQFRKILRNKGQCNISTTQIIPIIVGESKDAIRFSEELRQKGFYVLPVRPPTVPQGTARLRFSLTSLISEMDIELITNYLIENDGRISKTR